MGNRASKFVARHLQSIFHILAVDAVKSTGDNVLTMEQASSRVKEVSASEAWQAAYGFHRREHDGAEIDMEEILFDGSDLRRDDAGGDPAAAASVWRVGHVVDSLHQAFVQANSYFERNHGLYPNDLHTGTTATVVLQFPSAIVVASVGDSRAVLCCDRRASSRSGGEEGEEVVVALALTEDHTPQRPEERARIETLGGTVEHTGQKLRVNGEMAVTRSIGDFPFGALLTAEPDIFVFHRVDSGRERSGARGSGNDPVVQQEEGSSVLKANPCDELRALRPPPRSPAAPGPSSSGSGSDSGSSSSSGAEVQQFIVLASDGLFDVMSNDEVVYFVCSSLVEIIGSLQSSSAQDGTELPIDIFHIAAKQLAQEAYVRGSSDNIGVCIINLLN
jgi:serine/threonine protein phosphatase PrpC